MQNLGEGDTVIAYRWGTAIPGSNFQHTNCMHCYSSSKRMTKVNITHTEILSEQSTTLKKITYEIEKTNGEKASQTREVLDHGNAAACLLYNKKAGTVLFTRQFRIASFVNGNPSGMLLEVPAGLLEENEDPSESMLREIKEETGYEVTGVQKVYEGYSSPGAYSELLHLFVAEYTRGDKVADGGGLEEEGEDITVVELPYAKALERLEKGEIKDLKTILLLQYAAWKGLLA